jgi:hypothetical protein
MSVSLSGTLDEQGQLVSGTGAGIADFGAMPLANKTFCRVGFSGREEIISILSNPSLMFATARNVGRTEFKKSISR